jgi:hypothetical protein
VVYSTVVDDVGDWKECTTSWEKTDGVGFVFLWNIIGRSPGPPDVLGRTAIFGAPSFSPALDSCIVGWYLSKPV